MVSIYEKYGLGKEIMDMDALSLKTGVQFLLSLILTIIFAAIAMVTYSNQKGSMSGLYEDNSNAPKGAPGKWFEG